ncbi:MAG: CapA family protein [Proteobacteria bacterium]|jgi:poly-gamma-glutamate capsule biosynthesis protein CapA/YwtB (metallophosphatase superfamily)|nr:CapA family protein [Pseudomonadota bacterium]
MHGACRRLGLVAALVVAAALSCSREVAKPVHRTGIVAYAGDTVLARHMNHYVTEHGTKAPLAGIRGLLAGADAAVVNLESILASGGGMTGKPGGYACHFRGRPELVEVLTEAGVDVALTANNHTSDYGPVALLEQLRILRSAGIAPIGSGKDLDEATAPVFEKVGDAVVGFIGVHSTSVRGVAGPNSAGVNFVRTNRDVENSIARIRDQVSRARRYANVVLLVVHWGAPDSNPVPTKELVAFAHRVVKETGVDGILGSSSHVMRGVEVVDGRPIVYDAGNLLVDWPARGGNSRWVHQTAIMLLHVDRRGVRKLEAIPIRLGQCEAMLANPTDAVVAGQILDRLQQLSLPFGTAFRREDDRMTLVFERPPPPAPKKRFRFPVPPPATLPDPSSYARPLATSVPPTAIPARYVFENGLTLLGYELPETVAPDHGLNITAYWTAAEPILESYYFDYQVRCAEPPAAPGKGEKHRKDTPGAKAGVVKCGATWKDPHQPGDWMYPTSRWRVGEIVVDRFFVRRPPTSGAGPHDVFVRVYRGNTPLRVASPLESAGADEIALGRILVEE